jgi:hypothetical protein
MTVPNSSKYVFVLTIITMMHQYRTSIFNIEEKNFVLNTKTSEFLAVHFDASFYKALFLLNKTTANTEMLILDLDKMESSTYQIPIKQDFLFIGLMSNGNALLGTKTDVLLISKQDGYSSFNLSVPTQFFTNNRVSNFVHFNDYNQTMLFVFNDSMIGEIDARIPMEAKINLIPSSWKVANSPVTIKDMLYMGYGRKFSVLAEQNSLERGYVFQQNSKMLLRKLPDEVDDCVKFSYNDENNILTAFKAGPNILLHYDCDQFTSQKSTSAVGSGLAFNLIKNVYSPLGTSILIATTTNEVFFFDLAKKQFVEKVTFPSPATDVFWAEGTSFFVLQQQQGETDIRFKIYRMTSTDPRFCHKSCGGKCYDIFKPCYNMWKIFFSMMLGLILSTALVISVMWICKFFRDSDHDSELVDDMGNIYEMSESGELRQKRLTISLVDNETTGRATELTSVNSLESEPNIRDTSKTEPKSAQEVVVTVEPKPKEAIIAIPTKQVAPNPDETQSKTIESPNQDA